MLNVSYDLLKPGCDLGKRLLLLALGLEELEAVRADHYV